MTRYDVDPAADGHGVGKELERHHFEERRDILDGLGDVDGVLGQLGDAGVTFIDDGDDLGVAGQGLVENRPAVDPWQAQIGNQDVKGELLQPLQRVFAGARLNDRKSRFLKAIGDRLSKSGLVVDQQEVAR